MLSAVIMLSIIGLGLYFILEAIGKVAIYWQK
jgi:ABC-type nitrate/sulfonate/bicarbonate transport system permease component